MTGWDAPPVFRHDEARDRPGPAEHTPARPAALAPIQANALRLQRQAGNRAVRSLARWDVTDLREPIVGTLVGGMEGLIGSGVVWRQASSSTLTTCASARSSARSGTRGATA